MTVFNDLKLKKAHRYVIFKVSEDSLKIVVDKTANDANYDSFVDALPEQECRYAVYDFEYQLSEAEGVRNKICFFVWAPEVSKIKQKMLYASSKDALRRKLQGISCEVQATDNSELAHDAVLERVKGI